MKKDRPITEKEARSAASRIVAALAYADAEAAEKFGDLTHYRRECDIERVEEQFYAIIKKLRSA